MKNKVLQIPVIKSDAEYLAEFIGMSKDKYFDRFGYRIPRRPEFEYWLTSHVKPKYFQESWDWIMLVVDRLNQVGFTTVIGTRSCSMTGKKFKTSVRNSDSRLKAVYECCLKTIKHGNHFEKYKRSIRD